jgi:hypothetical protein
VYLMVDADLQAIGMSTPGNGEVKVSDYATIRQNLAGVSF